MNCDERGRGPGRAARRLKAIALAATLALGAAGAGAAALPALIQDAMSADPAILEARANEEVAGTRLESTRAQHLPVLGLQAGGNVADPDKYYSTPFRGAVGKVNLYAAGAIDAAVERDELRLQTQRLRTEETGEKIAFEVASLYLQALAAEELLAVEQANLARHQKIIDDLEVIVANDRGRRYELAQADSRALQVRTRIAQLEKNRQVALSRLTRYTRQPVTLANPFADDWQARLPAGALTATHPALQALEREAQSVRADQSQLAKSRWPRIDLEAGVGNHSYARVVANWSFFDRSADYNVDSAAKQIVAAERRHDLMERELAELSDTAQADMAKSQLQIKAAQAQIGASAEVTRLYEMQFKVGRRSLIELVNAYAEQASVEASRVQAQADWRNAVLSYLRAHAALAGWAQSGR